MEIMKGYILVNIRSIIIEKIIPSSFVFAIDGEKNCKAKRFVAKKTKNEVNGSHHIKIDKINFSQRCFLK